MSSFIALPWLCSQSHFFFQYILFHFTSQIEVRGNFRLCASPPLICLLELYVCLIVKYLSIGQHQNNTPAYPRQVVIVTVLQRIIRVDPNIQCKGRKYQESQRTTLSTQRELVCSNCLLLFCCLVPYRDYSLHLPSLLCFIPSLLGFTFPLILYGRADGRHVLKSRVSSYLPPTEA